MFDGKHGIALHIMQENGASSRDEGSLMVFLKLRWEPQVYSRFTAGMAM